MLGAYLHVPFCARKCDFCQFYKEAPTASKIEEYIDALELEVEFWKRQGFGERKPDTLFWGGGTPALLSVSQLERVAKIFAPFAPFAEWTIEASPASINKEKVALLKEIGVTRISLGLQSFNKGTLESLGRPHSQSAALRAIDLVAQARFEKFSVDLIFAAPRQTHADFEEDLAKAAALPVNHISAYCLEFESGTSCCAGKGKSDAETAREADFLEQAFTTLPALGFSQYEISNYAKPGGECLHNRIIWNMGQWLGFGPAAASQYKGRRFKNISDLEKWKAMQRDNSRVYEDVVNIDDDELFSSALIFGLRMNKGVDILKLKLRAPAADFQKYESALSSLETEGLLERETLRNPCGYQTGEIIRLTNSGRLLADSIATELL